MICVTVDATTIVSGFLRPEPPPGQVLAAWRRRVLTLVTSEPLLDQIARTFTKPYFVRAMAPGQALENMVLLRADSLVVPITVDILGVATHPEDDIILATALSGGSEYLFTSDHGLLGLGEYEELYIVSAAQFLSMLPGLIL
jgi:putative PIN family toxin of toxin-antitoxin system